MRTSHFFTAVLAFANFAQAIQMQTPMLAQLEANTDLESLSFGSKDKVLPECDKTPEPEKAKKTFVDYTPFGSKTSDEHVKVVNAIQELYHTLHIKIGKPTPFEEAHQVVSVNIRSCLDLEFE